MCAVPANQAREVNVLCIGVIAVQKGIGTTIVSEVLNVCICIRCSSFIATEGKLAIRLTTSGVATVSENTVPNVAPIAGIPE